MKRFFSIMTAVLAVLLFSCDMVHEFPDEEAPSPIYAVFKIKCRIDMTAHYKILGKGDNGESAPPESSDKYERRYIIEIYNNTESDQSYVETKILRQEVEDTGAVTAELNLHTKKYKFGIWMDYVLKGSDEDLYYETGNSLSFVHVPEASLYTGGTDYKDGQACCADVDLTPYQGEWYIVVNIEESLMRPMAKITFLATDIAEYAKKTYGVGKDYTELASEIKTQFLYNGFLPTGYNVLKEKLNDSETGYSFNDQPYYPYSNEKVKDVTHIGSDYVFVNGDSSSVTMGIVIKDKGGNVINKVSSIVVPTYRGKETIVMDKFFTGQYTPGVGIDPDFDGEWNIIIK